MYYWDDQIKDEMGEARSTHEGMRNSCKILVGKPEGRSPFRRPRSRLEDDHME
jgi:hypothetical protein